MNLPTTTTNFNDPKVIQTLKATIAKGASDAELAMFVQYAKSTGLDPFKKELWFIKTTKGAVQMMVGINGYFQIANKHPQYDGCSYDCVHDESGKLKAAWCEVYRKDRSKPHRVTVYLAEYNQGNYMWKQKPHTMLQKVAKSIALRESFPQEMNGLYTEEEMPQEYEAPMTNGKVATVAVHKPEVVSANPFAEYRIQTENSAQVFVMLKNISPKWIEKVMTNELVWNNLIAEDRLAINEFLKDGG